MGTLIALLIIVIVVVVLIWLINLVPNPEGVEPKTVSMIRFLAIAIVVLAAIIKVWPLLGSSI